MLANFQHPPGAEARSFIASRLGLTWGNGGWLAGCPQVKRALPTLSGGLFPVLRLAGPCPRRGWLADPAGVGVGDGEAEGFEFGDELAQAAVVVEPGAVVGREDVDKSFRPGFPGFEVVRA